uniref:Putative secreted protein n=1 Tax=Anopheles darlingi TaxID=43151 RepID=A0A2M4D2S8_ANODA
MRDTPSSNPRMILILSLSPSAAGGSLVDFGPFLFRILCSVLAPGHYITLSAQHSLRKVVSRWNGGQRVHFYAINCGPQLRRETLPLGHASESRGVAEARQRYKQ